jgi:hypothetical protein
MVPNDLAPLGPKKAKTGTLFAALICIIAVSTPINNFALLFNAAVCFRLNLPDRFNGFEEQ